MYQTKINEKILEIDQVICKNISKFDDSERGLLSQNILSQLRNLVEHVALKIFANDNDIGNSYDNIQKAIEFISPRANYRFLGSFHKLLQRTTSHYTLNEEGSERLMLKYYEYLLKIKSFLEKEYNLLILENIDVFPIDIDPGLKEYYEKIAHKISKPSRENNKNARYNTFYIQKIKPFFVNYQVYYEITFTIAIDNSSKFDRFIAFTNLEILPNYAVKLNLVTEEIEVLEKRMSIFIIDKWEVSIRPCEFENFAWIFGAKIEVQRGNKEYKELMSHIKETGSNLVEIIENSIEDYEKFRNILIQETNQIKILTVLDKCREIIKANKHGSNVLKFLLYKLNNKVIKQQFVYNTPCKKLSDLNLKYGCIPFDKMPFNSFLLGHTHKSADLFDFIDPQGREHELLSKFIKNNTEIHGKLYTHRNEVTHFQNIDNLINTYNNNLYYKHKVHRKLEKFKEHIFINGYQEDTIKIINKLKELSKEGIKNYSNTVTFWLSSTNLNIDCEEKKEILKQMFHTSRVALIYGAAGTGKTTLINHISNFFNNENKLYLSNTNSAVNNLKKNIASSNSNFSTVRRFLKNNNDTKFDILIIDESSIVSNEDMREILEKVSFQLLILVGDIFQIEAIRFGNWFSIAKYFLPISSVFELINPYRTKDEKLLNFWKSVRNIDDNILEHLAKNSHSVRLEQNIFERSDEDEIVLCLNYDGLYGLNNINKFLQNNNKNQGFVRKGVQTYKISDPILFNENNRFAPYIHNNDKGKIVGIEYLEGSTWFDIELDKPIIYPLCQDFELLDNSINGNSVIRFSVEDIQGEDEDNDSPRAVVPFQVAYAVSIHKAQGLEYNSVKIVLNNEVEEKITHSIFYTAITRTKEKLKIYWSPETEKKVLESFKKRDDRRDVSLLKERMKPPHPPTTTLTQKNI